MVVSGSSSFLCGGVVVNEARCQVVVQRFLPAVAAHRVSRVACADVRHCGQDASTRSLQRWLRKKQTQTRWLFSSFANAFSGGWECLFFHVSAVAQACLTWGVLSPGTLQYNVKNPELLANAVLEKLQKQAPRMFTMILRAWRRSCVTSPPSRIFVISRQEETCRQNERQSQRQACPDHIGVSHRKCIRALRQLGSCCVIPSVDNWRYSYGGLAHETGLAKTPKHGRQPRSQSDTKQKIDSQHSI